MGCSVLRGNRNGWQIEAPTKRLGDFATADSFLADSVIACTLLARFHGEPVETRDIGEVASRPTVAPVAYIANHAFFTSDVDEWRNETLPERIVNLRVRTRCADWDDRY